MKKVIIALALTIGVNGFAQSVSWVTKPRTNDTVGYVNTQQKEFIITRNVTQAEFDNILAAYGDVLDIKFKGKNDILNSNKTQVTVPNTQSPVVDTNSRGSYLIQAGQYKNAAIGVGVATSAIVGFILTQPSSTVTEYNTKATLAGVLSAVGGAISFGLNIAGNNMLIKAGLAKQ